MNELAVMKNKHYRTGFMQKIAVIFKDFSRTTFGFQGLPTRNVNKRFVHKCHIPRPS